MFSTTEVVFTFKILAEKVICAQYFTLYLLMLDMSRALDTIDRGIPLKDLCEILESDELRLVSLLLRDKRLQVKYNEVTGNIFTPDIGSPQGDCASPIWFIFYLHKAILAVKVNSEISRNILLDIKHDRTYVIKDSFNTLRPRRNEQPFADDIFKCIFFNENVRIHIKVSLKFVPKGQINNIPALVQIMAWRRSGDKPLSEPMMVSLTTQICVTRPQ